MVAAGVDMPVRPIIAVVCGLAVAGCSAFPELEERVTDRAEAADYMELGPIEPLIAERETAMIAEEEATDLMAAGLRLEMRGRNMPAPGMIDEGRAQIARAERAIIETAIARQRLLDETAPEEAVIAEVTEPSAAELLLQRVEELRASREAGGDEATSERIEAARRALLQEARAGVTSDTVCPPNRPDCAAARIRGDAATD
jgi:hypothetical protein